MLCSALGKLQGTTLGSKNIRMMENGLSEARNSLLPSGIFMSCKCQQGTCRKFLLPFRKIQGIHFYFLNTTLIIQLL